MYQDEIDRQNIVGIKSKETSRNLQKQKRNKDKLKM